jgi:hypothetical protein
VLVVGTAVVVVEGAVVLVVDGAVVVVVGGAVALVVEVVGVVVVVDVVDGAVVLVLVDVLVLVVVEVDVLILVLVEVDVLVLVEVDVVLVLVVVDVEVLVLDVDVVVVSKVVVVVEFGTMIRSVVMARATMRPSRKVPCAIWKRASGAQRAIATSDCRENFTRRPSAKILMSADERPDPGAGPVTLCGPRKMSPVTSTCDGPWNKTSDVLYVLRAQKT